MTCLDNPNPCPICPNKWSPEKIVRCHGRSSSRVLLLGEKPAGNEHRTGVPFVGLAGRELDEQYLPLANLEREQVMVSNACRCFAVGGMRSDSTPTEEEARTCSAHHLPPLLTGMENLELIVPMGSTAWSVWRDEAARDPWGRGRRLELAHGKLYTHPDSKLAVLPTYHPAASLHQPVMTSAIREDFRAVGEALDGKLRQTADLAGRGTRELWDGEYGPFENFQWISLDTEVDPVSTRKPWCLSFSTDPCAGWVVPATKAGLLTVLAAWVDRTPAIVLHSALYDIPILHKMGIDIPWEKVFDTMAGAWHRGWPQALKTLAYRRCGIDMREYADVVGPYAEAESIEYLEQAEKAAEKLQRPAVVNYVNKHGLPAKRRPMSHHNRIHRILADWEKSDGATNLRERWEKASLADTRQLLTEAGRAPLPEAGLSLVPIEEAIDYAAGDAIATGRVYLDMLQHPASAIEESDCDEIT